MIYQVVFTQPSDDKFKVFHSAWSPVCPFRSPDAGVTEMKCLYTCIKTHLSQRIRKEGIQCVELYCCEHHFYQKMKNLQILNNQHGFILFLSFNTWNMHYSRINSFKQERVSYSVVYRRAPLDIRVISTQQMIQEQTYSKQFSEYTEFTKFSSLLFFF